MSKNRAKYQSACVGACYYVWIPEKVVSDGGWKWELVSVCARCGLRMPFVYESKIKEEPR